MPRTKSADSKTPENTQNNLSQPEIPITVSPSQQHDTLSSPSFHRSEQLTQRPQHERNMLLERVREVLSASYSLPFDALSPEQQRAVAELRTNFSNLISRYSAAPSSGQQPNTPSSSNPYQSSTETERSRVPDPRQREVAFTTFPSIMESFNKLYAMMPSIQQPHSNITSDTPSPPIFPQSLDYEEHPNTLESFGKLPHIQQPHSEEPSDTPIFPQDLLARFEFATPLPKRQRVSDHHIFTSPNPKGALVASSYPYNTLSSPIPNQSLVPTITSPQSLSSDELKTKINNKIKARTNNAQSVQLSLQDKLSIFNYRTTPEGYNPFHIAALENGAGMMNYLLQSVDKNHRQISYYRQAIKGFFNAGDNNGDTPLHHVFKKVTAYYNNTSYDFVNLSFLNNGALSGVADVSIKNNDGQNLRYLINYACQQPHPHHPTTTVGDILEQVKTEYLSNLVELRKQFGNQFIKFVNHLITLNNFVIEMENKTQTTTPAPNLNPSISLTSAPFQQSQEDGKSGGL